MVSQLSSVTQQWDPNQPPHTHHQPSPPSPSPLLTTPQDDRPRPPHGLSHQLPRCGLWQAPSTRQRQEDGHLHQGTGRERGGRVLLFLHIRPEVNLCIEGNSYSHTWSIVKGHPWGEVNTREIFRGGGESRGGEMGQSSANWEDWESGLLVTSGEPGGSVYPGVESRSCLELYYELLTVRKQKVVMMLVGSSRDGHVHPTDP